MNLARRLAPILKFISSTISDWIFISTSAWVVSDAGKTARLNSGGTAAWQILETNSNKRSVTTGKYYFEITVSKYNVGDEQALRIGFDHESNFLLFMPRGVLVKRSNTLIPYMQSDTGNINTGFWGLNDVIGCSIEPSGGGNTNVRFYINGIEAGLNKVPYTLSGVEICSIVARGYRNNDTRDIEVKNQNIKYLPLGFEPW